MAGGPAASAQEHVVAAPLGELLRGHGVPLPSFLLLLLPKRATTSDVLPHHLKRVTQASLLKKQQEEGPLGRSTGLVTVTAAAEVYVCVCVRACL